jgi:hypothetical protein
MNETYTDKVSGRTLYVDKKRYPSGKKHYTLYYKDPEYTILHREDGPAEKYSDGEAHWVQNNSYHRMDGPSAEYTNGTRLWHVDGVLIDLKYLRHRLSELN